jgi:large subunit ribosomal protein L18
MGLRTQKRRRMENKTDYKARRIMLESGLPRIVIRRTNKYFILQAVSSVEAQDKVVLTVSSKDLLKFGWDEKKKGSLKSIPAGYLAGILMAKRLNSKDKYIVDLGMTRTIAGNRAFAVVAGLVEGGLNVAHSDSVFPSEERLMGEHLEIRDMIEKVKGGLK